MAEGEAPPAVASGSRARAHDLAKLLHWPAPVQRLHRTLQIQSDVLVEQHVPEAGERFQVTDQPGGKA